jgi:hypothetical protein
MALADASDELPEFAYVARIGSPQEILTYAVVE